MNVDLKAHIIFHLNVNFVHFDEHMHVDKEINLFPELSLLFRWVVGWVDGRVDGMWMC